MTTPSTGQLGQDSDRASVPVLPALRGFGWAIVGVIGLVICYVTLGSSENLSTNPRFWPAMCALIMTAAGVAIGVQNYLSLKQAAAKSDEQRAAEAEEAAADTGPPPDPVVRPWSHIWLFASMFAYVLVMPEIGYVLGTFLFLAAALWIAGFRSLWKGPLIAAILATGTAYLFGNLLGVALPTGSGILRRLDGIFF